MGPAAPIPSNETIVRRITPHPHNTKNRPGIGLTATSFSLQPRPEEEFPSWSRELLTDPRELLMSAARGGLDIAGWSVASVEVWQVRELGLDVVADPTEADPGHCLVVPPTNQRFTDKIWSKLAKKTRIIYTHPLRSAK